MISPALAKILVTIGSGGTFAIIILLLVFRFLRNKKQCNDGPRCVNIPEVRAALKGNLLSTAAIDRTELKVDALGKESAQQTTHLGMIVTQGSEQTKLLQKIANKK